MSQNLQVEMVYLYPKQNAGRHKTDRYEMIYDVDNPVPVLRRGFKFTLAIRFIGRNYQEGDDSVKLIFNFGPNPNVTKGTKGIVKLGTRKVVAEDGKFWSGAIIAKSSDSLSVEVCSPSDCPVGIWNLQIETTMENSTSDPTVFDYNNDIYLLFNPWNKDDLVYMPNERWLDEYVLNDVGKIWVGPHGSSKGREWVFGQFDACVLPAAMLMFEFSNMSPASRGDPIKLTRMISKMVNTNDDDNGVVIGRWDGDYIDGTAPSAWTGSVDILLEYLETQTSVSYGQCWVFSGVVTTICRALGIPSRVISNLISAHDANASLTVDKYYNANDEELYYDPLNPEGEDSIWNYHVWSDVWMARPDLPAGYGGWQAIDATPQEKSLGIYQCGPASVEAIKQGVVGLNYDVGFMVASVNADLMRWKEDPKNELGYAKIFCNRNHIGRFLFTKRPWTFDPNGDKDREDVTHLYKPKEGTTAERLSLYNAVRGTSLAKRFYSLPDPGLEDIEFQLNELDRIRIGENFSVTIYIKNKCENERNIKAALSATSVFYTGVKARLVKKIEGNLKMPPKSSKKLQLLVTSDDYLDKLVEYCNMKLHAVATVSETSQTWADEDDFQVVKPTIVIEIPEEIPCKKPTRIILRFINPLKKTLTNCKFSISGPTLRRQVVRHADVNPGGHLKAEAEILPKIPGEQKLIAIFDSKELVDITGSCKVDVYEEEE